MGWLFFGCFYLLCLWLVGVLDFVFVCGFGRGVVCVGSFGV